MKKALTLLLAALLALTGLGLLAGCQKDYSSVRSELQIAEDLNHFGFVNACLPADVLSLSAGLTENWYYRELWPETGTITGKSAADGNTLLRCAVVCSNEVLRVECTALLTYDADWALRTVDEVAVQEVILTVPESVETLTAAMFAGNTALTQLIMEPLAGNAEAEAFAGCTALHTVVLSDALSLIPTALFKDCTALKSVTCADETMAILQEAFSGCTALQSIDVGSSLQFIGTEAFAGCSSLESIALPDSLTYVKDRAFLNCRSLKKFTISANLLALGNDSLKGTDSLGKVTVSADNEVYAVEGKTVVDRALGDVITVFGKS